MKKKKSIIIIIISILVVIGIAIGLYFILNDKDKLTVSERNWVNQNIGTIQNINVIMLMYLVKMVVEFFMILLVILKLNMA